MTEVKTGDSGLSPAAAACSGGLLSGAAQGGLRPAKDQGPPGHQERRHPHSRAKHQQPLRFHARLQRLI
jgi:hypothetical protein